MSKRIVIYGAGGRMGERLLALGSADAEITIVAALESPAHPQLGRETCIAGIKISATLDVDADCVIDFSSPDATGSLLTLCKSRKLPLVLATTGLHPQDEARLESLARTVPVLRSPSMSQAVILAMRLSEVAAKSLASQQPDVEIVERHHRFKVDAPSGTALKFGDIVAQQINLTGARHGRSGHTGARPRNEIGYHAIRTGDNPGEHTVIFGMLGETLEISVKASNRDCYALGALAAAKFIIGKPAKLYSMFDIL
ncbi:MAG: 4-hydroxy-tetrahydrodipicolinate reductase [Thermoguttaceae bacterium]